ncbi:hypothetical protein DV515_00006475 [Chloebia gouldiae]|uniref:Uncharacterized protein n=1 Tax=Chloebia gouldiae TaxID=44316 RepID=A0A3L8SKQ3_CHLGU|nr:hypothetical protein DV515_00006475 [Chloebia gouldiae]
MDTKTLCRRSTELPFSELNPSQTERRSRTEVRKAGGAIQASQGIQSYLLTWNKEIYKSLEGSRDCSREPRVFCHLCCVLD